MRKAVSLKVIFWIEGEDEPANNFVDKSKKTLEDVIKKGSSSHPELKITIKNMKEHNEPDEDSAETQGDEF